MASRLQAFSIEGQCPAWPARVAHVEALLAEHLPSPATVLSWAIVQADPEQQRLFIEGSCLFTVAP